MAAVTKFNESWNVGNYAGTSNNAYTFRLEVIQNSQNVANNTSNITVNKYLKGINGWSWYQYHSTDAFSGSVTDSIDFFPQSMVVGTEYLIHTYTTNVTHNSEGALALSITNTFTPTGKYSSMPKANTKTISVALDTIARASNISLSSSSININSTSGSVSYTITPYSSSFTHTLVWTLGSGGATITNAQSGSISYSAMLNALSSATSGTLTLTLTTLSNGTAIGSKTATASVTVSGSSVSPSVSLSNIGVAETKISGYLIAGYSRASINSTTTNSSGSTGVTTTFTAENAVLRTTSTTSTSQITVQTDALPRSTISYQLKITATATDSRGNTASANKTANVYGYSAPTVSLQAYRVGSSTSTDRDDSGAWVYVTFSGALGASVNNQNSIQSTTCTYTGSISGTATNGAHYSLADNQSVTFTATVTDKVTSSTLSVTVSAAVYPLDLYDNGRGTVGVGFGTIAEADKVSSTMPINNVIFGDVGRTLGSVARIDADFKTKFRTETMSVYNNRTNYITPIRCDTASVLGAPQWSSGLALGVWDTNMYLMASYNTDGFYVGGGANDALNWVNRVYTDGYHPSATNATNLNGIVNTSPTSYSHYYPLFTDGLVNGTQYSPRGSTSFAVELSSTTIELFLGEGNSKKGYLRFCQSGSNYVAQISTSTLTATRFINFPNASGELLVRGNNYDTLWTGSLTGTNSITINNGWSDGYSFYCIIGKPGSDTAMVSTIIPKGLVTTSDVLWQLGTGNTYASFRVRYSGNNLIVTKVQSGSITGVFGMR